MKKEDELLEKINKLSLLAGDVIMKIYDSNDFDIELKDDESPLTKADKAANEVIVSELTKISDYPIVSEENNNRQVKSNIYWLVDPLDGTKEFIKRNGEFTVNVALIKDGVPVLGVVYAPAKDVLYAGMEKVAYKIENGKKRSIQSNANTAVPTVVTSRSHKDERTEELLRAVGDHKEVSMGSSLKLCLVAEGVAMLYPRLAPTCLWDTAAADAVVRAAGGNTQDLDGNDLVYDLSKNIKNPSFVVAARNSIEWQKYLKVNQK